MEFFILHALLVFLLFAAFLLVWQRDLLNMIILSGVFSLLSALLFFVLDAVDVSLTEVVVGGGISTLLFFEVLAFVQRAPKIYGESHRFVPGPLLLVLACALVLIYGTWDVPTLGDPTTVVHTYLGARYIEQSLVEIGIDNMVTSVLASYRGYDTLGEATVIFTAALASYLLLRTTALVDPIALSNARNPILALAVRVMMPVMLLFGLYVQFHGEYSSGGGFQAGVLLALGFVLFAMVYGVDRLADHLPPTLLLRTASLGLLLYTGVGLFGLFLGGEFLSYNVFSHIPQQGQHLGIFLVELGVGITVASSMLLFYLLFASWQSPMEAASDSQETSADKR